VRRCQLGQSGVAVSVVGLGGFPLGGDASGTDDARRAIEAARESGIDWIDTSEAYHERGNEEVIGRALGSSDDFTVSTKVAPDISGFRPEEIRSACVGSLRLLRRDHLDVYFLHYPDEPAGVPAEEAWGAMATLADEGLACAIGLSNFSLADVERCHELRRVDVVQEGLSLVDYLDARSLLSRCGELGIGSVVYEPLAAGLLTGAITSGEDLHASYGDGIAEWDFYKRLFAPGRMERSLSVAEGVARIAGRLGVTMGQLSVAWVLAQPGVSAALCGSGNPAHIRENAGAGSIDLDTTTLEELDRLIPLGPSFGSPPP